MQSLQGHFLVASPYLEDPNFLQTVVLLVHHSHEGAFGVVLNRPAENTVKELWEKITQTPCNCDHRVYLGGPVEGPLMAIHAEEEAGEVEVVPGVFFAAQRENLEKLLSQDAQPMKMFVGHSGWGSGQLEHELKEGAWFTTPATSDFIFGSDVDLWKHVTRRIGRSMFENVLGIHQVPEDPSLN